MRNDIIKEFKDTVDSIYGAYLDSVQGYSLVKKRLENAQYNQININKKLYKKNTDPKKHYNLSIEASRVR